MLIAAQGRCFPDCYACADEAAAVDTVTAVQRDNAADS